MKLPRLLLEFGRSLAIFTLPACGASVRPDDANGFADALSDAGDTREHDSSPISDVTADASADAAPLRNESMITFILRRGVESSFSARLIPDGPVPSSIDSVDGRCRTYDSLELPETRVGDLRVWVDATMHTVAPHPTRERYLYSAGFASTAVTGTRVRIDAEGSGSFPAFSIAESVPQPIEILEPAMRAELPWSSRSSIVIRWRSDGSTDAVNVIVSGRASATAGFYFTVCSLPIASAQFEITTAMLRRFDSLPEGRRIDVVRVREARLVVGNAPILLSVRNYDEGANWISFR
jgi:hypothetical protein